MHKLKAIIAISLLACACSNERSASNRPDTSNRPVNAVNIGIENTNTAAACEHCGSEYECGSAHACGMSGDRYGRRRYFANPNVCYGFRAV